MTSLLLLNSDRGPGSGSHPPASSPINPFVTPPKLYWCPCLTLGKRAVAIAQFRDEPAVNIAVAGNYKLAKWLDSRGKLRTYACRTTRVSPSRMMVAVPVVGKIGHRVTSYFRDFGQLDGVISDTTAGGFLCELEMTAARREKLASRV